MLLCPFLCSLTWHHHYCCVCKSLFCFPACRTMLCPTRVCLSLTASTTKIALQLLQFCTNDLTLAVAFPSFLSLIRTILPQMGHVTFWFLSKMVWNCFRTVFILKHISMLFNRSLSSNHMVTYAAEKGPASAAWPKAFTFSLLVRKFGNARHCEVTI